MNEVAHRLDLTDFRLQRQLGGGATGAVYLAEEASSGRQLAIKFLDRELAAEPTVVARFLREARAAAAIDSPHTVSIVGVGERDQTPFLAMDYVAGQSLAQRLSQHGPLPPAEAAAIARDCLLGLAAAHAQGVLHRDIKPSNILLADDRAILVDFGLAYVEEEEGPRLTATNDLLGSLAYMAPEQCRGETATAASDLYSLGVVLLEMLSGRLPYRSEEPMALLHEKLHGTVDLDLLRAHGGHLTPVVERLLQQEPGRRFQSAEETLRALEQAGDAATRDTVAFPHHSTNADVPAKPARRPTAGGWRRARVISLFALMAGVLAAASFAFFRTRGTTPPNHSVARRASGADHAPAAEKDVHAESFPTAVAESGDAISPPLEEVEQPTESPPEFVNSIGMRLIRVPSGSFWMGSDPNASWLDPEKLDRIQDELPSHEVRISRDFYLGAYEVTRGEFAAVMGGVAEINAKDAKEKVRSANLPMTGLTWHDGVEFCRRLSARREEKSAGRIYRLPTEAEWEYACRAGTSDVCYWGEDPAGFAEFAWCRENSGKVLQPVGKLKPNAWGFHDMLGNVYEWCHDWYDEDYYGVSPLRDPAGPDTGRRRVLRGGAYLYEADRLLHRSNSRSHHADTGWRSYIGFRVAAVVADR